MAVRQTAVRHPAARAVIFDWGGTLTPWHSVDAGLLWQQACGPHFSPDLAAGHAAAIHAAELHFWQEAERSHRSTTLHEVFQRAGVPVTDAIVASYFDAWDPHTLTDPEAAGLLRQLRTAGLRIGVLSNTMWPRSRHEEIFRRDLVLPLIDGAVYSCEIAWTKPHPEAFRAAMTAVGVTDPAHCVFVGDRPYDDIYGAKSAGMRAVLVANSDVPAFDGVVPDAVISRLSELAPLIESWQ